MGREEPVSETTECGQPLGAGFRIAAPVSTIRLRFSGGEAWPVLTIDELAVEHAMVGVPDEQFGRVRASSAQVTDAPGIVERFAHNPLAGFR
jgi:hypothetical protein